MIISKTIKASNKRINTKRIFISQGSTKQFFSVSYGILGDFYSLLHQNLFLLYMDEGVNIPFLTA